MKTEHELLSDYLNEFVVIDGLNQHRDGLTFKQWKWEQAKKKINTENFLHHNDTDIFGNCFSDADPGL